MPPIGPSPFIHIFIWAARLLCRRCSRGVRSNGMWFQLIVDARSSIVRKDNHRVTVDLPASLPFPDRKARSIARPGHDKPHPYPGCDAGLAEDALSKVEARLQGKPKGWLHPEWKRCCSGTQCIVGEANMQGNLQGWLY